MSKTIAKCRCGNEWITAVNGYVSPWKAERPCPKCGKDDTIKSVRLDPPMQVKIPLEEAPPSKPSGEKEKAN